MTRITVGIGDCAVSSDPNSILVTYGLGSCIAVAAWDPRTRAAGLLHYMFPDSTSDPGRFRDNPYLFADSGIPAMLHQLVQYTGSPDRLILRAAGGATVLSGPSFFNIGQRNRDGMRRALAGAGLVLHADELGGTVSRTLRLDAGTGRCWVEQEGRVLELGGQLACSRR